MWSFVVESSMNVNTKCIHVDGTCKKLKYY
jgi:hypothetical protein